jgi:hypothetical protein
LSTISFCTLFIPLLLVAVTAFKYMPWSSWAWRLVPAFAYLGASALNLTGLHYYSWAWIAGSLGVAAALVIRSLTTPSVVHRLNLTASSILLLIASCLATELCTFGGLLSGAFGITLGIQAISGVLLADLESQLGRPLDSVTEDPSIKVTGLAFLFPGHSGLFLLCVLLLGSVPGSLLFMIEDLLLHELFIRNWIYCVGILFITGTSGISLYMAYTDVFCGRAPESMPESWRQEPPRALRFLLLLFLTLGLLPALFV